MAEKIITLCYRKIIDVSTYGFWEKLVYNDTYGEFLLQAQNFNAGRKYTTFAQLLHHVPGADKLHYLVSAACIGYLQQLREKVPDIYNILGKQCLTFKSFRFEIINSDIYQKEFHQIAINFYSTPMIWHETVGLYLVVGQPNDTSGLTELVQLQPFLSIHSLTMDVR